MEQIWESENRAFRLNVDIKCKGKCKFRVVAEDLKPNSKYADRSITVDNYRSIYLSFPVTPKQLRLRVINLSSNTEDFIVKFTEQDLTTYDISIDAETQDFLKLAVYFSQVAGFEKTNMNGRIFQTQDKKFNIKFFPAIIDAMTNQVLNTPARIGHKSGIIEVSKMAMDKYTVAMRLIILLHEFGHKYRNPKMNLEISNEFGADISALYVYLGLGFSKVDAIYVFSKVFLKAQTNGNIMRMRKIMDYIKRFEAGEFARKKN